MCHIKCRAKKVLINFADISKKEQVLSLQAHMFSRGEWLNSAQTFSIVGMQ